MKILLIYRSAKNIYGWETGKFFSNSFRVLGHDVDEFSMIYETGEYINNLDPFAKKYNLVIRMEMNDPSDQWLQFKYLNCDKHIYVEYDTSYHPEWSFNLIKHFQFDRVFLGNPQYVKLLNIREDGKEFASYLPYAAAEQHFRPLDFPKTIDVGLCGSARPERIDLINQLQKAGINAQLISSVYKDQYIDALASCKIQVNQNCKEGEGLLVMRCFEAPAAGSLLLTERNDLDINIDKDPTLEYIGMKYNDINELVDACRSYLSTEPERQIHAQTAQTNVMLNHTYRERAQQILITLGV